MKRENIPETHMKGGQTPSHFSAKIMIAERAVFLAFQDCSCYNEVVKK